MSVAVLARTADPGELAAPTLRTIRGWFAPRPAVCRVGPARPHVRRDWRLLVLRSQGDAESVRDARRLTRILGTTAIEPALTDSLVRGDPAAIARLDRLVRERVIVDPVVRVKLWTPDGQIVYSDEKRLIGARYTLQRGGPRLVHA